MTVVRQETVLFHDTLRNNLAMYQEFSEDKLFEVLRSVGLDRYANAQSLVGMVAESGSNFSSGEKKHICLPQHQYSLRIFHARGVAVIHGHRILLGDTGCLYLRRG